jgi:hypothetical protein
VNFRPRDTSPEAAALQLDAWRRLGHSGRVELAARLSDEIRQVTLAGIRHRHPDYSEDDAFRALLRLVLGDELVRAIWPGDALIDP